MNCRKCKKKIKSNHFDLCDSCISKALKSRIEMSRKISLQRCICRFLCSNVLSPDFLKTYVPDEDYIEKYTSLFNHKFLIEETNFFVCQCKLLLKYKDQANNIYCCYCQKRYCLTCLEDHFPKIDPYNYRFFNCPNIQKIKQEKEELSSALKTEVKACPTCNSFISKEGCNKVFCYNCYEVFCFSCLNVNFYLCKC